MNGVAEWSNPTDRETEKSAFIQSTIPALESLFDEFQSASPYDQLSRAIVELQTLANVFRRLEHELEPMLAWRSGGMADVMNRALRELFPIDEGNDDANS